jgi:hypothetical protein
MASLEAGYIITYQVEFDNEIRKNRDIAAETLRDLDDVIDKRIGTIKFPVSGNKVVKIRTLKKTKSVGLHAVADLLEYGLDESFIGKDSRLVEKIEEVMNTVKANIVGRFESSGIVSRSGKLSRAISKQDPDIFQSDTRIFAGLGEIEDLDSTTSGSLSKRNAALRRAKKRQGSRASTYPYQTPNGERRVKGYWAFQDQGWRTPAGTSVLGRGFILSLRGKIHSEDKEAFREIPEFLRTEIQSLNAEIRNLLR